MKKIGIIGGLGPEATADYYKEIIKRFNEMDSSGSLNYPEMIIYSVNMSMLMSYFRKKEYTQAVDYLVSCIGNLKNAGADFAAISANTPHLLFNEIKLKSRLPLISIVETVRDEAIRLKLKKTGLIGTKFTMQATFYQEVFNPVGIEMIIPSDKNIETINEKLFSELELGIFKPETKTLFLEIIQEMKEQYHIDSLILGCTEFPLMFTEKEYLGIPFLNTTGIHVDSIVRECIS
jgi:aspartate racemase